MAARALLLIDRSRSGQPGFQLRPRGLHHLVDHLLFSSHHLVKGSVLKLLRVPWIASAVMPLCLKVPSGRVASRLGAALCLD